MVATTAKGIIKKVSLQKKAMHLTSSSNDEKTPVVRGYGVDFCPFFERLYDSDFCMDLSDRKNRRRNADGDAETKHIDAPMQMLPSIKAEDDD
ncbi:hypothetical protein MBANPS3_000966 [Mucor bainieri]